MAGCLDGRGVCTKELLREKGTVPAVGQSMLYNMGLCICMLLKPLIATLPVYLPPSLHNKCVQCCHAVDTHMCTHGK